MKFWMWPQLHKFMIDYDQLIIIVLITVSDCSLGRNQTKRQEEANFRQSIFYFLYDFAQRRPFCIFF